MEKELFELARERYGVRAQVLVLAEECSELAAVACKLGNRGSDLELREGLGPVADKLIDELADVSIMLDQMKLYFDAKKIAERRQFKLDRLATRLGVEPGYDYARYKKVWNKLP